MDDACAICLQPLCEQPKASLRCGHAFHTECIMQAMRRSVACPLCRTEHCVALREEELYTMHVLLLFEMHMLRRMVLLMYLFTLAYAVVHF
jgi:hypothetical protein